MSLAFNPFTGTFDMIGTVNQTIVTANVHSNVTPSTVPNGSTTVFTTPAEYASGSLTVFVNGLQETNVSETTTSTFTFDTAPSATDEIRVSYATS